MCNKMTEKAQDLQDLIELKRKKESRERCKLLLQSNNVFEQCPPLLDYTPLAQNVWNIIIKHWHLVSDIPGCESFPRIGFWKTWSLKDILTHRDIKEVTSASLQLKGTLNLFCVLPVLNPGRPKRL